MDAGMAGGNRATWLSDKITRGLTWLGAVPLVLVAASGCSPLVPVSESGGSTHVFVWAWDVDKDADDFLAVVDVVRGSATYGQVVRTLPAPGGRGAHHVEYEMSTSQLFANSFETGHTFVFDLGDAMHP